MMNLTKLTLNHLITLATFILAVFILLYAGQTVLGTWQTANSLDENLTMSTSPTLNRQSLDKALEILAK